MLCYAATADGLFGRATVPVLLYRVVHEPPRLDGVGDPELRALIAACLNKDPEHRPAAGDLLRWLADRTPRTDVLQGTAWLPPPVTADIARRGRQAPPPPSPPWSPAAPGLGTPGGAAPGTLETPRAGTPGSYGEGQAGFGRRRVLPPVRRSRAAWSSS